MDNTVQNAFAAPGEIRPASVLTNNNSQTLVAKRGIGKRMGNAFSKFGTSIKRSVSPPPAGNPRPGAPNTTPAFCKLSPSNKNAVIGEIRPALESAMGEPTVSGLAGIISDITQNPSTAAAKAAEIQSLFPIMQGPGTSNANLSIPATAKVKMEGGRRRKAFRVTHRSTKRKMNRSSKRKSSRKANRKSARSARRRG